MCTALYEKQNRLFPMVMIMGSPPPPPVLTGIFENIEK